MQSKSKESNRKTRVKYEKQNKKRDFFCDWDVSLYLPYY